MPDARTVKLLAEILWRQDGYDNRPADPTDHILQAEEIIACPELLIVPADTARTGWIDPDRDREQSTIVVWPDAIREIAAPGALDGWYRAFVVPDPRTEAP